jgi:DNA-binding MarR family transcriptional regulator
MDFSSLPIGTQAFIFAKNYYSVLSKRLESIDIERYYSIVIYIHNRTGCTQQEICDALKIDKTAMVKVIDYLVKSGFVLRETNPENRRQYKLSLTKFGIEGALTIQKEFDALDELLLAKCNISSKSEFLNILKTMSDYMEDFPSNQLFFNYKKTK